MQANQELLETVDSLASVVEGLTDHQEAEKKARVEFEEKILTALDGWKSKNDPNKDTQKAADKAVDGQIRKVAPHSEQLKDSSFLNRGYRGMKHLGEKKEGIYHWAIGFLTGDRQRMKKAYDEYGLTAPRNPGNILAKAALAEGAAGTGGAMVPEEWVAEIMKIVEESAAYRPRARVITAGTDTVHVAARNAAPSVTWKGEAAAGGTGGEPTYSQIDITVKKLLSIYTAAAEILEDANVDVIDDITEQLAEAVAKEEDRVFFEGDITGLSDPFDGLRFASSMEQLAIGNVTAFTVSHLRQAIAKLETRELRGAWWYFHPIELVFLMGLQDSQARPLWLPGNIAGNAPPTLYGFPYATTDVILRTRTLTLSDKSSLYFGNLAHSTIVDRTGVAIDQSIHSKFGSDQVDIRLRKRTGYAVHFPSALVRIIDFDTTTNSP